METIKFLWANRTASAVRYLVFTIAAALVAFVTFVANYQYEYNKRFLGPGSATIPAIIMAFGIALMIVYLARWVSESTLVTFVLMSGFGSISSIGMAGFVERIYGKGGRAEDVWVETILLCFFSVTLGHVLTGAFHQMTGFLAKARASSTDEAPLATEVADNTLTGV